jgi:transposase
MQEYLEALNEGRSRDEWEVTCVVFAPHAPEQNPIEDVWLKAKHYVRKHWRACTTFQRVMRLFEEALNTLSFQFAKLRMYVPDLQIT